MTGHDPGAGQAGGSSFVLAQFQEFFAEVATLRDAALISGRMDGGTPSVSERPPPEDDPRLVVPIAGLAPPAAPVLEDEGQPDSADELTSEKASGWQGPGITAEEAVQRLQSLLEMQALEAGHQGGEFGVLFYKEAQYVMAALADEIFVTLDWTGRKYWRADLLETRLFGTYNAGDVFYQRLDKLLQSGDRVQADIAIVYLLALTMGFRGRLVGKDDGNRIVDYKKKLYYYIYRTSPVLADPTHRLVPSAYQQNTVNLTARLLPSPSRWAWGVALAMGLYLFASHHFFHDAMHPLIEELNRADQTLDEVLE